MSAELSPIGRGPDERAMAANAGAALHAELYDLEREHARLVNRIRRAEQAREALRAAGRPTVGWGENLSRELAAVLSIVRGEPFWERPT